MRSFLIAVFSFVSFLSFGQTREIAITIDDLPFVASKMDTPGNQQRAIELFDRLVQFLVDNQVPATGFIIAGAIGKGQWAFLEKFKAAGFNLGSHTYSHYNLNTMNVDKYLADVARADKVLSAIMTTPKYFRYPYLAEGKHEKKAKVVQFLQDNHYVVAPVTIDSKDFQFNEQLYRIPYRQREKYIHTLKPRYLNYIWQQTLRAEKNSANKPVKQILLLHANLLNSYLLGDIIKLYQKNGYRFITLDEALANPAPALNETLSYHQQSDNFNNFSFFTHYIDVSKS